jgi:hypothetical protein
VYDPGVRLRKVQRYTPDYHNSSNFEESRRDLWFRQTNDADDLERLERTLSANPTSNQ